MQTFAIVLRAGLPWIVYALLAGFATAPAAMPAARWALGGAALSLAAMTLVVGLCYSLPANAGPRTWRRTFPGADTVLVLAGALVPVVALVAAGDPRPVGTALLGLATTLAVLCAVGFDLAMACRVDVREQGFTLSTPFLARTFLFAEVAPGPARVGAFPVVALRSGSHVRLRSGLVRGRPGDSLADHVFGPLLMAAGAPSHPARRGTAGLLRALGLGAAALGSVPREADARFFLDALGSKGHLGWRFVLGAAAVAAALLLDLAGALSGYGSLRPVAALPAPAAALCARALEFVSPVLALLAVALVTGWLLAGRARGRLLRGAVRVPLGSERSSGGTGEPWEVADARRLGRYGAAAALVVVAAHLVPLPLAPELGRRAVLLVALASAGAWLLCALRYRRPEREALAALAAGEAAHALETLERAAPDDSRAPWQSLKALARAETTRDLDAALELARRDLLRPAAPLTFLSACVAAAGCCMLRGQRDTARAIAAKLLVRFPDAAGRGGLSARCAELAARIVRGELLPAPLRATGGQPAAKAASDCSTEASSSGPSSAPA